MARKNPRRNITRVDVVNKKGQVKGGWQVRVQRRGKKKCQFFSDSVYGGKRKSLNAAQAFRDEAEAESRRFTVLELSRKPSERNQSGTVGVRLHLQKNVYGDYEYQYWHWVAQWTDGRGRRKSRSFSVHQYGDEEAFRMACDARKKGIARAKR